jgi:hypothetical protein
MSIVPETGTGTSLQDRGGCLTPAGLATLRSARPGQAPPALAAHLAGCVRCQERVLAVDAPRTKGGPRGTRAVAPSLGRTLLLGGLVLAAVIAALVTLRQLAGGP